VSDLTTFLAARMDEVEARGREQHAHYCGTPVESGDCNCALPIGYVLADLAAKRRLIEQISGVPRRFAIWGTVVLELLAQPFSDHEDFDPGWRL
jgi:hypothetical protein